MKISSGNVDRRSVLQAAALGSVAMAVVPRSSQSIRQRRTLLSKYGHEPADYIFITGVVVSRESPARLQVMDTDAHAWMVEVDGTANVWKGYVQRGSARVMVGDNVYVQGTKTPEGLIKASWIWDDIAWRRGRIAQVRDNGLVIATKHGSQLVNTRTLTPEIQTNNRRGGPKNGFRQGQYVEALGLSQKSGFSATQVWVSTSEEATPVRTQARAPLTTLRPAHAEHQHG
jgi:hypothetical protein